MVVDAHQHFWYFDPVRDSWITPEMQAIRRDFLPDDLHPVLRENGIDACVAVQADQSERETEFLLQVAREHDFVKGVVGWVDLQDEGVEERLEHFAKFRKLKGVRHIVQAEPEGFMRKERFQSGVAKLAKYGLTYDILIYPNQLDDAIVLVEKFPDQPFVLDHIAKPYIGKKIIEPWAEKIRILASGPQLRCKVSGMVTEADWHDWKPDDFTPYLDVIFEAFGPERLLFGSDWPVCLVAGRYGQVKDILESYIEKNAPEYRTRIMGLNASEFYSL